MTEYFDIAMTPTIIDLQVTSGSRELYHGAGEAGGGIATVPHELTAQETAMLTTRDSFYLASVSETGWPYVQHRGGSRGFVQLIDSHTIGWLERTGNRQYLGTGNITATGRIAAIFVDYPSRTRLKLYGLATHHPSPSPELLRGLDADDVRNDGAITVEVVATNWNCPKYITPRFTSPEVREATSQLEMRIVELETQLAAQDPTI